MAFMLYQTDDGRVPAWEYFNATGLTPKVGMALNMSNNKLIAATGTSQPKFICMREQKAAVTADDPYIPVIRVTPDMVFEVLTGVELDPGDGFTLTSDSMRVTVGEGSGIVEKKLYEEFDVTKENFVRVRFA